MRKFIKPILGVTLLEVMLVLAIAAMIIVMSVRYYQTATASQQANAMMEQIEAIVAAADNLAQASGSYSGITTSNLTKLLPGGSFMTPWGMPITVSPYAANMFSIISNGIIPSGVCPLLFEKLSTNNHFYMTGNSAGGASGNTPFSVNQCTSSSTLYIYYLINP